MVAWYLETSLLAGAGVETYERALRERIVWRGERFPVGVSGPPGLHLLVEEGGELSINSLSRAFLQLVPVRLFGTGQAAHIHEEKKRGGFLDIKVSRRSKKATSGSNRCFGHSVDSLLPVRACCHTGKSRGFGRFYLLLDLNQ